MEFAHVADTFVTPRRTTCVVAFHRSTPPEVLRVPDDGNGSVRLRSESQDILGWMRLVRGALPEASVTTWLASKRGPHLEWLQNLRVEERNHCSFS